VDETVLAAHEVHERAEIDDVDDLAVIDLADFGFLDDAEDPLARRLRSAEVGRADLDQAFVVDVDLGAGLATISRITLPPVPMMSRIFDLSICIVSMRGAWADSSVRAVAQRLGHFAQDVRAAFLGLRERGFEDFAR
jgi:hypothetical protein